VKVPTFATITDMGVRRREQNEHPPPAIGTKKQKFLENVKSAL